MQFFKNHDLEKLFNKIKGSQYPQKVKGLQYPPKQSNKIIRWGVGGLYRYTDSISSGCLSTLEL